MSCTKQQLIALSFKYYSKLIIDVGYSCVSHSCTSTNKNFIKLIYWAGI